jgi:ribosomal protein S18 acetylase RimI-like enzyme
MPEIEIRPAVEADIPVLVKMDHSYTSDFVWQMEPHFEPGTINAIFREVRLPRTVKVDYPRSPHTLATDWKARSGNLVALLGGELVGYCSLIRSSLHLATWISDLAVVSEKRRMGIGTSLILAASDWILAQPTSHCILLEMQPKNHPAIRLAEKLGFDFSGYIDHYYPNTDTAILFTKWII